MTRRGKTVTVPMIHPYSPNATALVGAFNQAMSQARSAWDGWANEAERNAAMAALQYVETVMRSSAAWRDAGGDSI